MDSWYFRFGFLGVARIKCSQRLDIFVESFLNEFRDAVMSFFFFNYSKKCRVVYSYLKCSNTFSFGFVLCGLHFLGFQRRPGGNSTRNSYRSVGHINISNNPTRIFFLSKLILCVRAFLARTSRFYVVHIYPRFTREVLLGWLTIFHRDSVRFEKSSNK